MDFRKYKYIIKILLQDYKKMIVNLGLSLMLMIALFFVASYIEEKQTIVEKFKFGIVLDDEQSYMNLIINILNKREEFINSFELVFMEKHEADKMIEDKELACYVYMPEGFTNALISGENMPLTFVANTDEGIKYELSKSLVKAATAFISSSQSGIYATLDYGKMKNIDRNILNDKIVMDINIEFAKAMMTYENYFIEKKMYPAGAFTIKTSYIYSFAMLFLMILGINFFEPVKNILKTYNRLKTIGYNDTRLVAIIMVCMTGIMGVFSIPLFIGFGYKNIFLVINISSLILFSSIFFQDKVANGVFLLSISSVMLMISGGVIPRGLLPNMINKASVLSINHYFIMDEPVLTIGIFTLILSGTLLFVSKSVLKKRV